MLVFFPTVISYLQKENTQEYFYRAEIQENSPLTGIRPTWKLKEVQNHERAPPCDLLQTVVLSHRTYFGIYVGPVHFCIKPITLNARIFNLSINNLSILHNHKDRQLDSLYTMNRISGI